MEANDGQEALDLATQCSDPIQLLITDIVMPRMNGRQLMEQLYPNHPETVVLYMSGYTGDILTHYNLDTDIPFLQKPFNMCELLKKVHEILPSENA